MKSRRNTSESDTAEPSGTAGTKLRTARTPQDSGVSGVPVEMNAWPLRRHGQPRTPDMSTQQQQQQQQLPQQQDIWQRARQSPRPSPGQHPSSSQRASSSSSQDGRNSGRGSRASRPAPIPTVGVDGEELYFPLSPAPPQRKSDTGTRLTRGSDSDVLPPDDRNYPVPVYIPAQYQGQHGHRIIHASAAGPPSVYWSDDGASNMAAETATIVTMATSTNPSGFTFYREGTPPPGGHDDDDDDDDEEGDGNLGTEKPERHRPPQSREIGVALSDPAGAAAAAGGDGGGGNRKARHGAADNGDDDDDDDDDGDGIRYENRDTAEFEFVNGRYVPPGLRDGRAPGRKPVSEERITNPSSYYGRGKNSKGGGPFFVIAAVVVFAVIATAVGVGVGLGISLAKKNNTDETTSAGTNATATTATTTVAVTTSAAAWVRRGLRQRGRL